MKTILLSIQTQSAGVGNSGMYIVGIVISSLILAYLVYALIKPEKF